MTILLALSLLQDADDGSRTWSFELKFDTVKRAARLAGNLKNDYDRGRMSWQRTALHLWYAVDKKEAVKLLGKLDPGTRRWLMDQIFNRRPTPRRR